MLGSALQKKWFLSVFGFPVRNLCAERKAKWNITALQKENKSPPFHQKGLWVYKQWPSSIGVHNILFHLNEAFILRAREVLIFIWSRLQRSFKILNNHFLRSCKHWGLGFACIWICVYTRPCLHIAWQIRLDGVQITVSSHSVEVHRTGTCDANAVKY